MESIKQLYAVCYVMLACYGGFRGFQCMGGNSNSSILLPALLSFLLVFFGALAVQSLWESRRILRYNARKFFLASLFIYKQLKMNDLQGGADR